MKRNLEELNMGMVKANFIDISVFQKRKWIKREFAEYKKCNYMAYWNRLIPIYNPFKTVMLGEPKTITGFGADNFIDSKILGASTFHGTYGMGGAGFFGLLCDTKKGQFNLIYTIWASSEYVLLDGRVIECHPNYINQYNPWEAHGEIKYKISGKNSVLKDAVITGIELSKQECKMTLNFKDGSMHKMIFYNYSDKLPPHGSGEKRKKAFETGNLPDYLLVTYKETELYV